MFFVTLFCGLNCVRLWRNTIAALPCEPPFGLHASLFASSLARSLMGESNSIFKQTLTECFFVTLFVDLNHLFDVSFETLNAIFPFPQVFSLSPFPLAREPTVTAWRGTTLGRDITCAISLIMPLRFVRRLRNNMAQSLVLYVKSDARYGRRLAAPIPSSKLHIPLIRTL